MDKCTKLFVKKKTEKEEKTTTTKTETKIKQGWEEGGSI